jgi:hypothetical protein
MIEIRETKPEEFDQVISFHRVKDYIPPISWLLQKGMASFSEPLG